ncbi:MAG: hypothetical protein DI582_01410 [Azospirillum brasilense]|nr:MAG: hypothetical protein DI582_01410 [Azospirillum brasilense]
MDKSEQPPVRDIATEPYKGPGALVTGVGEGAIAHYGTATAGFFGGGALSYLFHKQVGKAEQKFKELGETAPEATNFFSKAVRYIAGQMHRGSEGLANHFPFSKTLLSKVPKERLTAVVFGGGLMGVMGFFVAPVYFMFTGTKHASDGKRQFQEAQDEIITTRAELGTLREKYVATRIELEDLKTTQAVAKGTLKVSGDDTPRMDTAPATAQLATTQTDSPVSVSEPKIDAPKVEGPKIETNLPQPPAMPWGEKIAAQQAAAELASHEPARA